MLVRLAQAETAKIAAFTGQKEKFMKKLLIAAAGLSILPALAFAQGGAAGKWTGEQQGRGGTQPVTLELKADGGKLTGTMTTGQNAVQISDGTVDGSKI